jgi:poly(3-hydroxybutyrate) depolymerase
LFHGWSLDENAMLSHQIIREAKKKGYVLVSPRGLSDKDVNKGQVWSDYRSWTFRGSSTGTGPSGAICRDPSAIKTQNGYNYNSCSGGEGNANKCAWTHCMTSDVNFMVALYEHLKANVCFDLDNVFAAGESNGGMFTWELAQNTATAGMLRAIAPIIGLPHAGFADPKGRAGDLPVLMLMGGKDKTVPPGNWGDEAPQESNDEVGFLFESASTMSKRWASDHGCNVLSGEPTTISPIKTKATGFVCKSWCTAPDGKNMLPAVLDCRNRNMGHDYSYAVIAKAVLNFFDKHSM